MQAARPAAAVIPPAPAAPWSTATFGNVKRTYASAVAPNEPGGVDDAHDSHDAELDPWARHAGHANGFGDATPTGAAASAPEPSVPSLRAYALFEILAALCAAMADAVRRVFARWRRQRDARLTALALRDLDARTLQDIGLYPSETASVAAEISGAVEASRVRVLLGTRTPLV